MEVESITLGGVTEQVAHWYDVPGLRLTEFEGDLEFDYLGISFKANPIKGAVMLAFESHGKLRLKGPQALRVDLEEEEVSDPAKVLEASVIAIRLHLLGFWYSYAEKVFSGIFRRRGRSRLNVMLASMHAEDLGRPPMLCMEVFNVDTRGIRGKIVIAVSGDLEKGFNFQTVSHYNNHKRSEVRASYTEAVIGLGIQLNDWE